LVLKFERSKISDKLFATKFTVEKGGGGVIILKTEVCISSRVKTLLG